MEDTEPVAVPAPCVLDAPHSERVGAWRQASHRRHRILRALVDDGCDFHGSVRPRHAVLARELEQLDERIGRMRER